jgi:hypothetical protein
MDISAEKAIEHLRRWKTSAARLSVAVRGRDWHVFSRATITAVSDHVVVFAFSEIGDGLSVSLNAATRFRSLLPSEAAPPDVGGSHKACLLFLVITLQDGSLCKVMRTVRAGKLPVILFSWNR